MGHRMGNRGSKFIKDDVHSKSNVNKSSHTSGTYSRKGSVVPKYNSDLRHQFAHRVAIYYACENIRYWNVLKCCCGAGLFIEDPQLDHRDTC